MKTMNIKKTVTAITLIAFTISAGVASEKTDLDFDRFLTDYKVNPKDQQAYCYTDENGELQGKNVDLKVRLASVSKLLTSLWAVDTKGLNFRYDTKLFIKGNSLHLQGSFDPFMSNEKMLFLISQLNTLGYTHFDKITYDKNIQINPNAQVPADQYPLITRDSNGRSIKTYFNTALWSKNFQAEYDRLVKVAAPGRFLNEVTFDVDKVEFSEKNPFYGAEDVRTLTLTSPELYKYLKETNVQSNNYSAHTIFRDLGGEMAFEKYLLEKFNLTKEQVKLYNGSGLPTTINGKRLDNYASCRIITTLLAELKLAVEKQEMGIEAIVAVPGSDQGTFRNRLNSSDLKNTFIAKTGSLMHTSTLAGGMSTQRGFNFFGIFNQTTDLVGAKSLQNEMVRVIMDEMGGPEVFGYTVEEFHTYHKDENVKSIKNLNFFNLKGLSDFTSIEGKLE